MSQYRESREDKFRRLAEARVNKILHLYRLLGNLSWTGTYAYTKDQVDQIFTTLQAELLRVKLRFLRTQSTAKKRFVLSEPYTPERFKISEDNPTLAIPLPDGTYLRAVGYPTDTYPCIDIYWDNGINAPTDTLCFVEFNPNHEEDERVCIGAYRSNQDDPNETAYGTPLYWMHPFTDGEYNGCYFVLVREGVLVLSYDEIDNCDHEIFIRDSAHLCDAEEMHCFLTEWNIRSTTLVETLTTLLSFLERKEQFCS